ncbi:MAG: hypothetical protein OQJ97_02595 [Rhodospirillales bacterium]|nr:hypothetical protein [Rhodospirillales bacterium]
MMTFETATLSSSEQFALALIRERGAAVVLQGARPCAGKGGCGKTCAKRAATVMMSVLAMDGRRRITLHSGANPKVSPDEMSLLCLIAATQLDQKHLAKALTLWLVPPSHGDQMLESARLVGDIFAAGKKVLPLRFMAPPMRRGDTSGLYALTKPQPHQTIALPRSQN